MPTPVLLHPHAAQRLKERGASADEVVQTVRDGAQMEAKFGRQGFRRDFPFDGEWRNRHYMTKQIEAYAVFEDEAWLVITVIVKFF